MQDAPEQVTDAQRREALRDPEMPQQVKRILKKHLFGAIDGRREVRSELTTRGTVHRGAILASTKPKKPEDMSGRQWKRLRKAANRILEGRTKEAS